MDLFIFILIVVAAIGFIAWKKGYLEKLSDKFNSYRR